MKILHKKYFAFLFLFLSLAPSGFFGCSKYSNDADLRLARDFIDAYYVEANQQKAMTLSNGHAAELLQREIELVKDVENRENSYRTRDVTFDLKKENKTAEEVDYFYELNIVVPDLGTVKKNVSIIIDRKNAKVKDFSTVE